MQFCPTCGTRLIHASHELFCHHCNYKSEIHENNQKMTLKSINNLIPSVEVLEGKVLKLRTLPTVDAICEECTHTVRAETWTIPTGSEGILSITLHKCTFCGHTWRETG